MSRLHIILITTLCLTSMAYGKLLDIEMNDHQMYLECRLHQLNGDTLTLVSEREYHSVELSEISAFQFYRRPRRGMGASGGALLGFLIAAQQDEHSGYLIAQNIYGIKNLVRKILYSSIGTMAGFMISYHRSSVKSIEFAKLDSLEQEMFVRDLIQKGKEHTLSP